MVASTTNQQWDSMTPDQLQRFVRMEEDIKHLRRDVQRLEQELESSDRKREAEAKALNEKLDKLIEAEAAGRGSASTWPKAGALLVGTVAVVAAIGGWLIAFWKLANNGQ